MPAKSRTNRPRWSLIDAYVILTICRGLNEFRPEDSLALVQQIRSTWGHDDASVVCYCRLIVATIPPDLITTRLPVAHYEVGLETCPLWAGEVLAYRRNRRYRWEELGVSALRRRLPCQLQ
jgi:hypothetical protein